MLDSDCCIYLMNGRPEVVAKEPLHECCISSIVLGELEYGVLNSNQQDDNRLKLDLLLGSLPVIDVDKAAAKTYAELRVQLKHKTIGPNDLWIAGHALSLDMPLVTNNTREFSRVPDLVIDTWLND